VNARAAVLYIVVDADECTLLIRDCQSVEQVSPSDRSAEFRRAQSMIFSNGSRQRIALIAGHAVPMPLRGDVGEPMTLARNSHSGVDVACGGRANA
jgi:hypothetical protein